MNKHQYRAVATAILAVCASFALWTTVLPKLPLPQFSSSTVTLVKGIISELVDSVLEAENVTVKEVTVENLGSHFATTVKSTHISASVVTQSVVIEAAPSTPEPEPEPVAKEEEVEEVVHSAPQEQTDLEQWELLRAWNIAIPSLQVRAPVLLPSMKYWSQQAWDLLEEQMQVGLNNGTVAYPHSVSPGSNGSLIIAGHSSPPTEDAKQSPYGSVFAKLPEIAIGEQIEVETAGTAVTYVVEDKVVVSPKMTTILEQQTDDSILKLITCYPVGTTRNRMIITARKVE